MNGIEFGYNFYAGKLLFGLTIAGIGFLLFCIFFFIAWIDFKIKEFMRRKR